MDWMSARDQRRGSPHLWAARAAHLPFVPNVPEIRRRLYVYRDISRCSTGRPILSRYRKCETAGSPESKSRGNLCSRKQGSAPAGNTIEKANRDQYYASLLASMQNNSGPMPAVKSAKLPEPSPDCDLQCIPNQGRDSTATSSATADATTLVVPAGSRQTETFRARRRDNRVI